MYEMVFKERGARQKMNQNLQHSCDVRESDVQFVQSLSLHL